MNLNIQVQGIAALQRRVANMPKQMRYAGSVALNFAAAKLSDDWKAEIGRVFDRPTPYVQNSPRVTRYAKPETLQAWVAPAYPGGKGVDPDKVLLAEVFGGARRAKRFEVAFRRAGVLPQNMAMVPASWLLADPAAGDGHGGIKGSFITRLISYLQAAGTIHGNNANMTAKRRAKLSGKGRWISGRFHGAHTKKGSSGAGSMAVRQGGVEYFVSKGRAEFTGRGSWKHGQQQHLRAGIWQRTGLYGADVKPVFLFTRMPRYQVRLKTADLAARAMQVHLPPLYRAALQRALETAR